MHTIDNDNYLTIYCDLLFCFVRADQCICCKCTAIPLYNRYFIKPHIPIYMYIVSHYLANMNTSGYTLLHVQRHYYAPPPFRIDESLCHVEEGSLEESLVMTEERPETRATVEGENIQYQHAYTNVRGGGGPAVHQYCMCFLIT